MMKNIKKEIINQKFSLSTSNALAQQIHNNNKLIYSTKLLIKSIDININKEENSKKDIDYWKSEHTMGL